RIERLVTGELIGKAQTVWIEQPALVDDQRVLERGAKRIAGVPELGDVAHEPEGTGARKLAPERRRFDVEGDALAAAQGMIEVDIELDAETVRIRPQLTVRLIGGDADGLQNADVAARDRQRHHAGLVDRIDER